MARINMLFHYKCIHHDFEKLHEFFEHTVLEVWCKPDGDFDIDLLHRNFRPIVSRMPVSLLNPIKEIYEICIGLTEDQREKIVAAFKANNSIEELCAGAVEPVFYDEIKAIDNGLETRLKTFCVSLYDYVSRKATFCSHYKSINDFYHDFIDQNNEGKCPFCGLVDLKSNLRTSRDAFDHYMPKKDFPFNTVNVQNLAPACNDCNSVCKKEKIPLQDSAGNKRKSFFPYSPVKPDFKIIIQINSLHPTDPTQNQVEISFSSATAQEEVDTWRLLYNIDERYNDKCCSPDAKYWMQQVNDEAQNYGVAPHDALNNQIENKKKYPLQHCNFLRVPFLKGCQQAGIL